MRRLMSVFFVALLVGACGRPAGSGAQAAEATAPAFDCEVYDGAGEVAAFAQSHVIIFGEAIHGTNESPAAFFALICELAQQGMPVKVGLEAEHDTSAGLNTFLDHPDDTDALIETTRRMWSVHDGRSSEAILKLLRQLAGLRAQGADVTVFAFDASWELDHTDSEDWGTIGRDAKMAEHVNTAVQDFPGAVVLLTGGFHARKQAFEFDGTRFEPMASKITARPVLSLEMKHAGGSGWMWGEVDGEPFKGAVELTNMLEADAPVRAYVLEPTADGGDGAYYTGPITASSPAFPAAFTP